MLLNVSVTLVCDVVMENQKPDVNDLIHLGRYFSLDLDLAMEIYKVARIFQKTIPPLYLF